MIVDTRARSFRRRVVARAFTLAELMVVLLVLSILAGLAGLSYSGTENDLFGSNAKSVVSTVAQAEQRFAVDYGTYTSYGPDLSSLVNRGITLTNSASTGAFNVSLALGNDGTLGIAVQASGSGGCESAQVAPLSAAGVTPANAGALTATTIPAGTACTGENALPSGDTAQTPVSQKY